MVLEEAFPPFNRTEDVVVASSTNSSYNTTIITTMGDSADDAITDAWAIGITALFFVVCWFVTKRQPVREELLWHRRRRFLLRGNAEVEEDPEIRKVRIQKALSIQKVMGCDAEGILQLGENSGSTTTPEDDTDEDPESQSTATTAQSLPGAPSSADHATYESSTCCICLEPYEVGETVAWNRRRRCLHVFHEECITGWLAKHNDCPTCRKPILKKKKRKKDSSEEASIASDDLVVIEEAEEDEASRERAPDQYRDTNEAEEEEEDDATSVASVSSSSGAVFAIVHGLIARVRSGLHKSAAPSAVQMGAPSSSTISSPMKTESATSPAIFRRRVVSFGGVDAPSGWTPVRGSSTSTSNETSDEECGMAAPLQRAVSLHSSNTSCGLPASSVEDRAEAGTLQIVQMTQPWMADSLLSDTSSDTTGEGDDDVYDKDDDDTEEDDIIREDRSREIVNE